MFSRTCFIICVLAALAGCQRAGPAPATDSPQPAAGNRGKQPPFLVYEATGRTINILDHEEKLAMKYYVCSSALRTEDQRSGMIIIVRFDKRITWVLDPRERVCVETTFNDEAEQRERDRRRQAAGLQNEGLSAAERRRILAAIGQIQPVVEIKADDQTVDLLGHGCRHVSCYEDGDLRIEAWITGEIIPPCDLTAILTLTGDFSPELVRRMQANRGFRLRTRLTSRMPKVYKFTETEVIRLETPEKLDPALFEPPAGYRLIRPRARGGAD